MKNNKKILIKKIIIIIGLYLLLNNPLEVNANNIITKENLETTIVSENLMTQYFQINWNKYNNKQKKELNNMLIAEISQDLEISIPKLEYFTDSSKNNLGYTILGKNIIYLNESKLDYAQYMFKTISHEARHLWQWKKAQDSKDIEGIVFFENFNNYISSINMESYIKQPTEVDADLYSDIIYNELINLGQKYFNQ